MIEQDVVAGPPCQFGALHDFMLQAVYTNLSLIGIEFTEATAILFLFTRAFLGQSSAYLARFSGKIRASTKCRVALRFRQ
ncbi:MAG: hypothetical protein KGH91_05505 [Rhodospirillales bacterium]|nr:hypothetical protein [Rhodospirillales bacterium]